MQGTLCPRQHGATQMQLQQGSCDIVETTSTFAHHRSVSGPRSFCTASSVGHITNLWDPLHASDVAPDARDGSRLQRSTSHRTQAALRRWVFPPPARSNCQPSRVLAVWLRFTNDNLCNATSVVCKALPSTCPLYLLPDQDPHR